MSSPTPTDPLATPAVPPLRPGDRLSREEFERRYDAMPPGTRAELLEGEVFMPSPVRVDVHGSPHMLLGGWLAFYRSATPGVQGGIDSTVRLDVNNEPQPDAVLYIRQGGQARTSLDGYIELAPELVVEVAASSADRDLSVKFNAYCRNEVREYLVVRTEDRQVDWFAWREGKYERLLPDARGWFRSEVFPGLWLDPDALLRDDPATMFAVLQQGLASPEHADFVARLDPPGAG